MKTFEKLNTEGGKCGNKANVNRIRCFNGEILVLVNSQILLQYEELRTMSTNMK